MANKDIDLAFDPSTFLRGFKKMETQSQHTNENMIKHTKKTNFHFEKLTQAVSNVSKKLIMSAVGIFAAFKGLKGLLNSMPEIGQAFGIAKDIFLKNLLWPLRQAVMPLLKKLLDWVRDNRAQFVKWGMVLRNVFSVVVMAVKGVIDVAKSLTAAFFSFFNAVFGTKIKSMEEFLNLLTFKLAVALEYFKILFANIFGNSDTKTFMSDMGEILSGLLKLGGSALSGLFKGFSENIGNAATPIAAIAKSIHSLIGDLSDGKDDLKGWENGWAAIGKVLADTVVWVLERISDAMKTIENFMKTMKLWDEAQKGLKGAQENLTSGRSAYEKTIREKIKTDKELGEFVKDYYNGDVKRFVEEQSSGRMSKESEDAFERYSSGVRAKDTMAGKVFGGKQNDAFISKDGRITPLSNDDNILATKKGGGKNINVSIDFSGMVLHIANASPQEANNFSYSMVAKIRDSLNLELSRTGAK